MIENLTGRQNSHRSRHSEMSLRGICFSVAVRTAFHLLRPEAHDSLLFTLWPSERVPQRRDKSRVFFRRSDGYPKMGGCAKDVPGADYYSLAQQAVEYFPTI